MKNNDSMPKNDGTNIEGKISINSKGLGFVKHPDFEEDIFIEAKDTGHSLSGDNVRIRLLAKNEKGQQTGQVVKVLDRAREQFVGTVVPEKGAILIKPDNHKIHVSFLLTSDEDKVEADQKVLIKMESWNENEILPKAKLLKIFGHKGEHEVEMQSIVYDKGFVIDFPEKVEKEAELLKTKWKKIPEDEIARRRDMREDFVMTIDPVDAKDFDDALSFKHLENGNYEIGIHIADVSHYVTTGSELDKEASERAFSVYLVDRTIPMLPEILSNDLCSLNPNEEKLAFSTIFEMNDNGDVLKKWFGRTVIKSKKRFSYEEAQAVLDAESGPYFEELSIFNAIAKKMAARKSAAGAINFEKDEIKFELDKDGRPIRIVKKERMDTHKLIEEFMLLSNREVAKYIFDKNRELGGNPTGLMYRVHDMPDPERIRELSVFLKAMGYILPINDDGSVSAKDLNALLQKVDGKAEESLIKTATIRTMSKAIYSPQNTGHFGLAFQYYTHFTSPIRRYPDILVHRIMESYLVGEQLESNEIHHLVESAERSTQREISAAEAERESIKYKQAEYMQDHIGEEFEGVISGVAKWGVYVVLDETLSEGMIHISKLGQDYFSLDEKNYAIIGERTGKKFTLGDPIKVKIESIDVERKQIDMGVVERR